ncbi:uncharacterized protein TRIVIDRAFT_28606 [Trichoderma virens Gv29-8]|uniref:NAD(P)-binding domain-containing protein n=1 Tax=Hypocrea virens (strain Gv29-8 / FGSC 10586) TaxID=413071 RepID=G9MSX0_HYPVG|nr:uncharacterized protein TRIVIDRAFT_28606 [Trichoderma virens Gv29-8]EHK23067.1 hypothetical protein TRIVIDRAFT_28606 [Trichoderma virens Gv29-8]UKZ48127.1 hypothetical protein TrVGV298_002363 [Trichoderma virens]
MSTTVGIAGFTGQFAQLLSSRLLKSSNVNLRGFCRNASKVAQSLSSLLNVEVIQGEAQDRSLLSKFVKGCDIVVCCYQGDDKLMIDGQKALIDACEAEQVPRYAYLETKETVKGVHILIGVFFETLFSPYFEIYDAKTKTFSHWGEPGVLFEGTSFGNAADYTARVILDKNATGVKRFVGDTKSLNDIAQSFEKVYNVKSDVVVKGSAKELYDKMWSVRQQPSSSPADYMAMFYQHYIINEQTYVGPYLDITYPDIKRLSFEDFMKGVAVDKLPNTYRNPVVPKARSEE